MTPETRLAALFAAEAPPLRDFAFEAEVLSRITRRRAIASTTAAAPAATACGVLAWVLTPTLAATAEVHIVTSAFVAAGLALGCAFLLIKAAERFSLR
jgi:hypothetical protein